MRTRNHPAAAAAVMRGIGHRRPLPSRRAYLCGPCAVSWAGNEADCWNCGHPATAEYARAAIATQALLTSLRPAAHRTEGAIA